MVMQVKAMELITPTPQEANTTLEQHNALQVKIPSYKYSGKLTEQTFKFPPQLELDWKIQTVTNLLHTHWGTQIYLIYKLMTFGTIIMYA